METKELVTKNKKHKVVLRKELSGGEIKELTNIMVAGIKYRIEKGAKEPIPEFEGDIIVRRQERQLEVVLVSIDGVTDNLLDRLDALPGKDYQEVVNAIQEIVDDNQLDNEEKKD